MARTRFHNLDPERRESILSAAAEEFADRGYAGTSISRVLDRADLSKGSLYYYFDDKADLFATVVDEAVQRLLREAGGFEPSSLSRAVYWESIRGFAERSVGMPEDQTWYGKMAAAFPRLRLEPAAVEAVKPALEWGRRWTREILSRGQELGVIRVDLPLELLVEITMAMDEAADRWMAEHAQDYDEAGLRAVMHARLDLLRDSLDVENEGSR